MSNIPEFKFDFGAVEGLPFEEAARTLFLQLEGHYNEYIKPAPILFGGSKVSAPVLSQPLQVNPKSHTYSESELPSAPVVEKELIRVEPDWEIKEGKDLNLKDGKVLVGIRSDNKSEIFDFLKNYDPQDQVVTGESGKYDLGRKDG